MIRYCIVLLCAAVLLQGCGKKPSSGEKTAAPAQAQQPPQPAAEENEGGPVNSLVDHITGRSAVKRGQKAMSQIREISEERDRDLEAAMEMEP
jgi:hypothetical protein